MATLDYQRRKAFINALVSDSNMRYVESDEVGHGTTRGKTIIMPRYSPTFTDEQNQKWMEQLLSNCYHNLPDNVGDIQEIASRNMDLSTPFGQAFALVSKHNCHNKRQGIYPGADNYITEAVKQDHQSFIAAQQSAQAGQISPELEAIKAFDMISRSKWQVNSDYDVTSNISSEANTYLNNLLSDPSIMQDYQEFRNGGEPNIEMTKRLIKEMHDDEEEGQQKADEMEQEAGQQQEQQGQGEGQGEANEGGEGSESEGAASRAEGAGEGEEDENQEGQSNEVKYEKRNVTNSDALDGNGAHIKYEDSDFYDPSEIEPLDTNVVKPTPVNDIGRFSQLMDASLSSKVRNILKVFSQARYQGGKKRGKINKRRIATVSTGNDRIFRTKESKDVLDTAVTVLIDNSGSMSGSKYHHAAAAGGMLTDCLSKLNVPHSIYGFSETSGRNNIYVHKTFSERKQVEEVLSSFASNDVRMGCNADAEAVSWAHDQLIGQKQKRKILIVLSDGSPVSGSNPVKFLKQVVNDIETKSPVEIYGLGIMDKNVKKFYKNHAVIERSDQLEATLLELIKGFMVG